MRWLSDEDGDVHEHNYVRKIHDMMDYSATVKLLQCEYWGPSATIIKDIVGKM